MDNKMKTLLEKYRTVLDSLRDELNEAQENGDCKTEDEIIIEMDMVEMFIEDLRAVCND